MSTRGNFAAGPQGPAGLSTGPAGGDLGGTYPDPTLVDTANVDTVVRSHTLDSMAAPTANVNMNSHKLTNLAVGSVSTDSATFGQIPTALPPSGSATGDLTGTYPAPTLANTANVQSVVRSNRLEQMAAPLASVSLNNQKITNLAGGTAASDGAAFGQIPSTLPPSGAASGDLAGTYPSPTLGNTANVQSVVRTNRLDQMATPTAPVAMGSQKITGLANGTVSTDAAAFGQIPTTLPPNGTAGGDLSGTYPNPTVAKLGGVSITGTPVLGQAPYATSSGAAAWSFNPFTFANTGTVTGGIISFHAGQPTQFDISAGSGIIADYTTNPASPTLTKVTIAAQTIDLTTFVASPAPTTRTTNWWLVNSSGTVIVQGTTPTNTQRRTLIVLGVTGSVLSTGVLFNVQPVPVVLPQPLGQLYDLMYALGPFNISGNVISANGANLSFNKSAGTTLDASFNAESTPRDPHVTINPVETPVSFRNSTQLSGSQGSLVTTLDVTHYDVGGTVTLIPGANGTASIQRVWLFGTETAGAQVALQYSQTFYNNLATATSALAAGSSGTSFITNPDYNGIATLIGWIVVTKQCTSLLDTTNSSIILAPKFAMP